MLAEPFQDTGLNTLQANRRISVPARVAVTVMLDAHHLFDHIRRSAELLGEALLHAVGGVLQPLGASHIAVGPVDAEDHSHLRE